MITHHVVPSPLTQESTQSSTSKSDPEVGREANDEQGYEGSHTPYQQNRLPTNSIRYATPSEAGQSFGEGEGGDEDAGLEGCTGSIADAEVFHHDPCIGKA